MRISTANKRRRRALRRRVYIEALTYHGARCLRLAASGNLHRLKDSGFVRRRLKRPKGPRRFMLLKSQITDQSVRVVEKELEDLGNGGPMHHMFLNLKPVADNY